MRWLTLALHFEKWIGSNDPSLESGSIIVLSDHLNCSIHRLLIAVGIIRDSGAASASAPGGCHGQRDRVLVCSSSLQLVREKRSIKLSASFLIIEYRKEWEWCRTEPWTEKHELPVSICAKGLKIVQKSINNSYSILVDLRSTLGKYLHKDYLP